MPEELGDVKNLRVISGINRYTSTVIVVEIDHILKFIAKQKLA